MTKPTKKPTKKATAKTTTTKPKATTTATITKAPTTATTASGKVNANTATIDELAAAFTTAGIPNAEKWAAEVDEYRPYPDDPKWGKLRAELGKYKIDPAVLEKIIATLEI